jgi:bacterioferritin (cytochrome b1)
MANINEELITMLNQALALEHAAEIQYLAHAELIKGTNSEKLIERIKEIASDEAKHADKFRTLISSYLGGEPAMELAATHKASGIENILNTNLKDEKIAIDFYKKILDKVLANKDKLTYCYERLEHEIRHIILDEEEHVVELVQLLGE